MASTARLTPTASLERHMVRLLCASLLLLVPLFSIAAALWGSEYLFMSIPITVVTAALPIALFVMRARERRSKPEADSADDDDEGPRKPDLSFSKSPTPSLPCLFRIPTIAFASVFTVGWMGASALLFYAVQLMLKRSSGTHYGLSESQIMYIAETIFAVGQTIVLVAFSVLSVVGRSRAKREGASKHAMNEKGEFSP